MLTSVYHPTLYTPATTASEKLLGLVNNGALISARRIVLCTEDAIREDDIPAALDNLRLVFSGMDPSSDVSTFVRVRNPWVLSQVLDLPNAERLAGFVIPKVDPQSFPLYADQLLGTDFRLLPILESHLMMDRHFRETLRSVLTRDGYRDKIDCVRIGANDLMGHLGLRRDDTTFTIYDTPVGNTIHDIVNEFRGLAGFTVTAPVFECFGPGYDDLLRLEVRRHILNGLYGQTIIHPRHIRIIRDLYKVSPSDLESAQNIMFGGHAVKGLNGKMDEPTTHSKWAEVILERQALFGSTETSTTLLSVIN